MNELNKHLFRDDDLSVIRDNSKKQARHAVDQIPEAQFLTSTDEQLFDYVFERSKFGAFEWYPDRVSMVETDVMVDARHYPGYFVPDSSRPSLVHGLELTFEIPFAGKAGFWKLRPSSFMMNPPFGTVRENRQNGGGRLEIKFRYPTDIVKTVNIKRELDQNIQKIETYLGRIRSDIEAHHKELEPIIRTAIEDRRKRIGRKSDLIESLAIPLKRNPNAPDFQPVPLVRKHPDPLPQPKAPEQEYAITDDAYEYILKVIRHEGRTYEALRRTFRKFGEEELRDVLLAHLNGHFHGLAKGEAFRNKGKTDIQIEFENRAAFVGECKVWTGPNKVRETLNQLLGYVTWRDVKLALVYFNKKNKDFSGIQNTLPSELRKHPNFVREDAHVPTGEWRFIFRSLNDTSRLMTVHVFLFDVQEDLETGRNDKPDAEDHFADIKQKVDAGSCDRQEVCLTQPGGKVAAADSGGKV